MHFITMNGKTIVSGHHGESHAQINVAIVNSFVLYNHIALLTRCRPVSENDFRDELVLQIIEKYGRQTDM